MPKPNRSREQRELDLAKTARMYLSRTPQDEIAKEIGVNQSTISRDLKTIRERWQKSALRDFDAARAEELAKVDNLEIEYWQAWRASQQDAITETREGSPDGVAKVKKTRREQVGDVRFLQGVQWCIDKRCELLGLDAPRKLEHSGSIGSFVQVIEGIPDEAI